MGRSICLLVGLLAAPAWAAGQVVLVGPASASPADPDAIDTLRCGHWHEVPNSRLEAVAFAWPAGVVTTLNGTGVRGVVANWSGGAYDTKRDRLIVWGGGHKAYAGNEFYTFDLKSLRWQRANDPSLKTDPAGKLERTGEYEDGTPRSAHSYNYVQYVPAIDRFVSAGTAATWPSGQGGSGATWTFDFETKRWSRLGEALARGIGAYSAVDPVTGHLFVRGNGSAARLAEWDPRGDVWTDRTGGVDHKTDYAKTAAIDPIGRRFLGVGGGKLYKYEIGRPGEVAQDIITTAGPQDLVSFRCPGLEYDPVLDKLVGWKGGAELWALDLRTLSWERLPSAADNQVTPTAPCDNGTYGRFRYVPSRNVYILVNGVRENVFICRLTDRAKQPIPERLAQVLRGTDAALVRWAAGEVAKWPAEKAKPVLRAAHEAQKAAGPSEVVHALRDTLQAMD